MFIKLERHDIEDIANKSLQMGGVNTPLEVALAKKCLSLLRRIGEQNNERNEFRSALISVMNTSTKCVTKIDEECKARKLADGCQDGTGTQET